MTTARNQLVDINVTPYYHCISRCVRRAMLCGEGFEHRKQWIEDRIELLAENFAISVGGFAVMDNHLHLLLRLDSEELKNWSDEEIDKGQAVNVLRRFSKFGRLLFLTRICRFFVRF